MENHETAAAGDMGAPGLGRIVVGVDGSPSSRTALLWATLLAGRTGAVVDAVMVCETPRPFGWSDRPADLTGSAHHHAARHLEFFVEEAFGPDGPSGLRTEVLDGDPAERLLQHAVGASMLVVGRRGHGRHAGWSIGSVSARCTARAGCPVLVVHDQDPAPGP